MLVAEDFVSETYADIDKSFIFHREHYKPTFSLSFSVMIFIGPERSISSFTDFA